MLTSENANAGQAAVAVRGAASPSRVRVGRLPVRVERAVERRLLMRHAPVDHLDREGGPHPRLQVAAVRLAVRRGARSGGLGAAGSGALWPAAGEGGGCLGGDEHARPHVDARARPAAAAAVRVCDQVAEDPVQPQAVREDFGLQEGLVDLDAGDGARGAAGGLVVGQGGEGGSLERGGGRRAGQRREIGDLKGVARLMVEMCESASRLSCLAE